MNKYRIANPNNNKVREYKSRTTEKMVGNSTRKDVTAGYVKLTAKKRREINMKLLNPEKRCATINSGRVI